ncbi:sulfite exporter TauE/SafE family protein [soil metagenome]
MIAMLAGVAATSVLGSVHCVAMCGPLVGLQGGARSVRLAAVHSLGRLATYLAIGALAGLAGSALDLAGRLGEVQRLATIVAGLTIVGWGVLALVRTRMPRSAQPPKHSSAFGSALVHIRTRRPTRRMLLLGLITGLLPCGWLWAFAIAAAGTGSPLVGALVMFAFWLGTAPAMIGIVGLAGPLVARLRARLPLVTSLALIALGLATLGMRWRDAGVGQIEAPHCHCHAAAR